MYELIQVAENSYYIQSPAKIGLFKLNDTDVCLIDSGNDKDAGRKIRQILDTHQWHLNAIYNTHSNADHIGGNKYLQGQTGCKIYAPGIECDFTRYADLLQACDEVVTIRCNVLMDGLDIGEYTSDFVCTKINGDMMVREWRQTMLSKIKALSTQLKVNGLVDRHKYPQIPPKVEYSWSGKGTTL